MDRELRFVLKATRKKIKLTQESLADLARCSRSLIASIEKGSSPSASTLQRIIQAVPEDCRSALENTREGRAVLQGTVEFL
jgi:transcriptional regulator with XRE-family HTH domain